MPTQTRPARTAAAVTAGCTLAVVLGVLLSTRTRPLAEVLIGSDLRQGVLAPAFGLAATLVLRSQPANRFGWLMLAQSVLHAATVLLANAVAVLLAGGGAAGSAGRLLAPIAASIWLPALGLGMACTALIYPSGTLQSRRWRPVAWVAAGGIAALTLGGLFSHEFLADVYPGLRHPITPAGWETAPVVFAGLLAVVACGGVTIVGLGLRWRRARPPVRAQLGWFLIALAGLFSTQFVDGWVVPLAATIAFPLCLAAAVVRHGWFDGDLLLSRTIAYAALSVLIVGAFAFGAGVVGRTLGGSGVGAVVAALAIAVFLAPVRERVQHVTDRLVFGERRDPHAALTRLGRRLDEAPHPDDVLSAVVETVRASLRAPYAAVRFPGDQPAATAGEPTPTTQDVPLRSAGTIVATLVVGLRPGQRALDVTEAALLAAFAVQAAPAVAAVRLTHDLRRSRERLVVAREEERRRLRHDLHDGLGPTLAGLALGIGAAARSARRLDPDVADLLNALESEARSGLDDVRRIAHDLRPAALDELGLMAAIRQHADAVSARDGGLRVSVTGPAELTGLPAAAEVAAFRIVLEAVTNVVRHADATTCDVTVRWDDTLTVCVVDDGIGLPGVGVAGGVGLASMAERTAELGGTFTATRAPHGGTMIIAVVPVADSHALIDDARIPVAVVADLGGIR